MFEGHINQDFRVLSRYLRSYVAGKKCLDVGCGHGLFSRLMIELGASDVTGVDFDPHEIQMAQSLTLPRSRFLVGDAACLPVGDESMDFCLSTEVLTHLPPEKRLRALREIFRVLAPGGKAIVTFHNQNRIALSRALSRSSAGKTANLWPTTRDEMCRDLSLMGFRVISKAYLNYFNRLSVRMQSEHPGYARFLSLLEDAASRIPLAKSFSIVFMVVVEKP